MHNRRSLLWFGLAGTLLSQWPALVKARAQADPDTRPWWFVFLEAGRKTPDDKAAVQAMQVGHIDNFKRLHGEKKLFAAGPLRDPSGLKRGIVVVRADARDMLAGYFQPDAYVREGYMTLNAAQATVHKGLISEGIDPNGVEEVRIVLVPRPAGDADAAAAQTRHAHLQRLLDDGTLGAWYTLHTGPWAELLFARSTDTAGLQAALAALDAQVWQQWIGKGVVPGPRR